jgi:exo-1,4-beta-D-glucosaminidase
MNFSGKRAAYIPFFIVANVFFAGAMSFAAEGPQTIELSGGWQVQAAAKVAEKGEAIAAPAFEGRGWYRASVPSTVLAVLVDNSVYKDIYFGENLSKIPTDQFKVPWWYRNEFTLPDAALFVNARLIFEGINFSADVFLNGSRIAAREKTFGSFRIFDLDVTTSLKKGKNVLAVKVSPPKNNDFTIGFVDWNPEPPDRNMGIFRPVKLRLSGPVSLEYPFVKSSLDTKTLSSAGLTVSATVTNRTDREEKGTLKGIIGDITFTQEYSLLPRESRTIEFSPEKYPQLIVKQPRLWWPAGMGKPELYKLQLIAGGAAGRSDSLEMTFGVRQVQDYINEKGYRGYKVNGRKILIRGGGWADELLLRENEKNLDAQMRYTLQMNLNTIRLEGFWGSSQRLYDLADRYGILVMVGWSCQWEWKEYCGRAMPDTMFGGAKTPEEMNLFVNYFHDQVTWLRNHPSIFVWTVGSDKLPYPEMEKQYRKDIVALDPTRPLLASCANLKSTISGWSAVKMKGPYDYVTPNYWYVDKENGGAFGFNTETGPGPQPPVFETLKKIVPEEKLWPVNETWDYHCGRNEFNTMDRYLAASGKRYGVSSNADEFCFRAQAVSYEAMRPMFEAFAVNRQVTTGIIQWMHNASWPKFYWQFYDYYLIPTGAFYGAKKACQPLSLVYDYGDDGIYLVNQTFSPQTGMTATITVWDAGSKRVVSKTVKADVGADASMKIADLPAPLGITPVYFLDMSLSDRRESTVSDNFYWLSAKKDVIDKDSREWYITSCREWADFSMLSRLPPAAIAEQHSFSVKGDSGEISVTLSNSSDKLAFFIEMRVCGDLTGRTIVPVFWDDNYITLVPSATKTFHATYAAADLDGEKPVFKYRGWNVAPQQMETKSQKGVNK